MENLSRLLRRLNECLSRICDVESRLYATGIKALFIKHDYSGYGRSLSISLADLADIADQIEADASSFLMLKRVALEYIAALRASTAKLLALNDALAAKANGNPYSMSEYKSDYREFQQYQLEYLSLGDRLNQIYSASLKL
jgi:hypothetical protein